ncbi:phosphoglycerate kinase, partial [Staphylococcus epidermidis]|uniref:phosphoglycerate kinase n=1 Tax=Staphylococcus epidermidis TaxID=1282 RepID=UPI0011A92CA5
GYLIQKQIKFIPGLVNHPQKPLLAILPPPKLSHKINLIKNLLNIPHKILIPPPIPYTFIKPQPNQIPLSLFQQHKIHFAKHLLENNPHQILFPVHCKIAKQFSNHPKITQLSINQ